MVNRRNDDFRPPITRQGHRIHHLHHRMLQPIRSQDDQSGPKRLYDLEMQQQTQYAFFKNRRRRRCRRAATTAAQSRYIQNDCIHLRHTPKDHQPAHNHGSVVFSGQVELGRDGTAGLMSWERLEGVGEVWCEFVSCCCDGGCVRLLEQVCQECLWEVYHFIVSWDYWVSMHM